ncbi:MAG: DUF2971 domain-containing protein [Geminicoccaceae bacterium]
MKLYRFEKIEERRLTTLEAGELWATSPRQANDYLDCRLQLDCSFEPYFSRKQMKHALAALYKKKSDRNYPYLSQENFELLVNFVCSNDSRLDLLTRAEHDVVSHKIIDEILDTTAICCFFAKEPTDPLMWAHYGDNHHGFCVEYEVYSYRYDPPAPELIQVMYTTILLGTSVNELLFSPSSSLRRVVSTKRIKWSHESEYRIVSLNGLPPQGQRGIKFKRPNWLVPKRLICGEKQSSDTSRFMGTTEERISQCRELNDRMALLAHNLDIPRSRVKFSSGRFILEDIP